MPLPLLGWFLFRTRRRGGLSVSCLLRFPVFPYLYTYFLFLSVRNLSHAPDDGLMNIDCICSFFTGCFYLFPSLPYPWGLDGTQTPFLR